MKCPHCGYLESKVVDSRPTEEGLSIRRRRECIKCKTRFTTYEKIEETPLIVVKKDGNRERFDRNKILIGIIKSCEKRPISIEQIESIADNVEKKLQNSLKKEITSTAIGEIVINDLKDIDEIAYVRFASVYRQFKDVNSFLNELQEIIDNKK